MTKNLFSYKLLRHIASAILLLSSLLNSTFSQSLDQSGQIRGRVFDRQTGEALPGANIQIEGTMRGASSDRDGNFVIERLQLGNYALKISFIGYEIARATVTVKRDSAAMIDVAMQPSTIAMAQVVVTASRQSEEIKTAVVSVSSLQSQEALRRNVYRLDAALESIPGVSLMAENVNVRNSSGYTRGLGSRVLVLMDYVPVLISDFGNMNWDMLPVTDFDHVEVVKGPASALYGSYALGGVINILTKSPQPRAKIAVRASAGFYDKPYHPEWEWTDRTLNFNRVDMSYSQQFGALGVRLSAGRSESTGDRENRHFQRWNGTLKLIWRANEVSEFTLFGAYARDRRGEFVWSRAENPYLVPIEFIDYRMALDAFTVYGQFSQQLNDWMQFKIQGSLVTQLTGNQFRVEGDFQPATGPGANMQLQAQVDENASFTVGLEYHYDFAEQRGIGRHFAYKLSPYLQTVWQSGERFKLTGALRYDYYYLMPGPETYTKQVYNPEKMREETWTVVNPIPAGLEEEYLSPQIGTSYQLTSSTVLHSALGRGIRIPALGERFLQFDQPIPFVPNANVLTESSFSYELGLRQRFGSHFSFEATGFSTSYKNLIEPLFVADATQFYATLVNIPGARISGIEATTRFRFWGDRLRLDATATWTDPVITDAGDSTGANPKFEVGQLLSYRPKLVAYITPSLRLGAFALEADYSYASKLEQEQLQLFKFDQRVNKRQLDLRLLTTFGNLTTQLAVRNVMHYNYFQVERNINEPRSFTAGLMWEN